MYDTQGNIRKYYELNATIEDLGQTLKEHPAYRLLPLVQSHGDYKGEITHITKKQFRKHLGKDPSPNIVKNGKIRWELFLDQLNTSEHGGREYDQDFKDDIEALYRQREQLNKLKAQRDDIRQGLRRTLPIKEVEKIEANAPVFPKKEKSRAIVTAVDGLSMTAKRNPSFYQIEDNDPKTPHIRVRYSADARKLMNAAARSYREEAARERGINIPKTRASSKPIQMEFIEDTGQGDIVDTGYSGMPVSGVSGARRIVKRKPKKEVSTERHTATTIRGMR